MKEKLVWILVAFLVVVAGLVIFQKNNDLTIMAPSTRYVGPTQTTEQNARRQDNSNTAIDQDMKDIDLKVGGLDADFGNIDKGLNDQPIDSGQ